MSNHLQSDALYTSLSFCFYSQGSEKIPADKRDLGNVGVAINYALVVAGATSDEMLQKYMKNNGVSNITKTFYHYKIMGNFGMLSYFLKKIEGKENQRAMQEVALETMVSEVGGKIGNYSATRLVTSKLATRTATKIGISLGSRILAGATAGATIGSGFPIVGTIVGAIGLGINNLLYRKYMF